MNIDDIIEIARLKGRVIALEAQVQTLEAEAKVYEAMRRAFAKSDSQEVTRLKAEVERLRKAGDAMADALNGDYNYKLDCVEAWNAAKEGKQP